MYQIDIEAQVREARGKGEMRRLRAEGMTPAVVYGAGSDALLIQVDSKSLMKQLLECSRKNTVVTMKIDNGEEKPVLIKEIQTHPVKDSLVHADFLEIDLEKQRQFVVPVEFTGKAKGVDLGGVVDVGAETVVMKGKPLDIPDSCTCDVSELEIGDSVKVGEIEIPESVELITGGDVVCVQVLSPMAAEAAAEEDEE